MHQRLRDLNKELGTIIRTERSMRCMVFGLLAVIGGIALSRPLGGIAFIEPDIHLQLASAEDVPEVDQIEGHSLARHRRHGGDAPVGLTPQTLKAVYGLPENGGKGTIAVIIAFDAPNAEQDLAVFSETYGFPPCTSMNGCFEKKRLGKNLRPDAIWALQAALDLEWAHAVAPGARLLLVEARSALYRDLLEAVDHARAQPDVVAVVMGWGGKEFRGQAAYNERFEKENVIFLAALGQGVTWPAASSNVIAVGATTLHWNGDGGLDKETAWSQSGGGVSAYEDAPKYQKRFGIPNAGNRRALPDVSVNGDPASGLSVYSSTPYRGMSGWFEVGGTSAGPPVWAGIHALSGTVSHESLYGRARDSHDSYFRDIKIGSSGKCFFYCSAKNGFDYLTGLGSPVTAVF